MDRKDKDGKSQKNAARTGRRVWLSIIVSDDGFEVKIGPDLGAAWKRYFRLCLRTVLLAILVTVTGCEGAPRTKKVISVLHSLFARNSTGTQEQQK